MITMDIVFSGADLFGNTFSTFLAYSSIICLIIALFLLSGGFLYYRFFKKNPFFAFDKIVEGMSDVLIVTNSEGSIRFINQETCKILGYTVKDLLNTSMKQIVVGDLKDKEIFREMFHHGEVQDQEVKLQSRDGKTLDFSLSISPLQDNLKGKSGYVLIARDIQKRKRMEGQWMRDALYDCLTGLPNRGLLMDRLRHALQRSQRRKGSLFAVLFLDLDRFKEINDTFGHRAGDQFLVETGKRLRTCIRPGDTVARLGGDEFAIILNDVVNLHDAVMITERIQKELKNSVSYEGREVSVTSSIGITLSTNSYHQPEDILRDADTAMYRAKALGKNRYAVFDQVMNERTSVLQKIEADLRQAFRRQEFKIYYQPMVSSGNGRIVGLEALVRWQHPQHGLISAAEFVPVAEETGLIVIIGEWILRKACYQNKLWQEMGLPPINVAINLSNCEFKLKDLKRIIENVLKDTGLDPQYLELELTEGSLLEIRDTEFETLFELNKMGVKLSIDDFGTGYSSLSNLKKIPIHKLKIDSSFVRDISSDPNDAAIVSSIITLAHNLGLEVIAEGVETEEQRMFLRLNRCDLMQGSYFSTPISAEEVTKVLNGEKMQYGSAKLENHRKGILLLDSTISA